MIYDYSKQRIVIVVCVFLALYTLLLITVFRIQILNYNFYTTLGTQQHTIILHQMPPRAPILDRSQSHFFALNHPCFSAFITPNKLKQKDTLHCFLKKHFPPAYERLMHHPETHFMYIKRDVSKEELNLITHHALPDIQFLKETKRYYPVPSASPVIGMTDIDNKGLFGLEQMYDQQLAGSATSYTLIKDARSGCFHLSKEQTSCGTFSQPLVTTLDHDLQFLVSQEVEKSYAAFRASEITALVMDPATGDILALVNVPYAHPSDRTTCNSEHTRNRAFTDAYERGSVMKIFAALAALEEGVVTADELIDCKGSETAYIDGRKINTWTAHGVIPFKDVVALSNNIGTAIVAKRLNERLYEHYDRLGFGKKTRISFPGQTPGFLNHPKNWSKQSIISLCYGYEVSISLVQLARALTPLAHDGYMVEPRLILDGSPPLISKKPLYKPEALEIMREILTRTTDSGTAKRARMKGYTIMSKTGTANLLINGEYNKKKNLYTCAGIVQKDNYQRIIVTSIKEAEGTNLYASTVAAPLFKNIAEQLVIHERKV